MTFDWAEYLRLAEELTKPAHQEARLRCSISRAYFAAYCTARNFLRDKKGYLTPIGPEAQGRVRDEFKFNPNLPYKKIGENLGRLKNRRNKADYDDTVHGLPSLAASSIAQAQNVISSLSKL